MSAPDIAQGRGGGRWFGSMTCNGVADGITSQCRNVWSAYHQYTRVTSSLGFCVLQLVLTLLCPSITCDLWLFLTMLCPLVESCILQLFFIFLCPSVESCYWQCCVLQLRILRLCLVCPLQFTEFLSCGQYSILQLRLVYICWVFQLCLVFNESFSCVWYMLSHSAVSSLCWVTQLCLVYAEPLSCVYIWVYAVSSSCAWSQLCPPADSGTVNAVSSSCTW